MFKKNNALYVIDFSFHTQKLKSLSFKRHFTHENMFDKKQTF